MVAGVGIPKAYSYYSMEVNMVTVPAPPIVAPFKPWVANVQAKISWYEVDDKKVICSNSSGCLVAFCYLSFRYICQNAWTNQAGWGYILPKVIMPFNGTERDAQIAWESKVGTGQFSTYFTQVIAGESLISQYKKVCFLMMLAQTSTMQANTGALDSAVPFPGSGGNCAYVPPFQLVCTTSGKVDINYGTLDGSKLNGATASTTLSFSCNQAATAEIKLDRTTLDLGRKGDLTAAISIGGKDLASGSDVAVKNGTVTTTITSTLKAKGTPTAGPFEGSGVLIIGYY